MSRASIRRACALACSLALGLCGAARAAGCAELFEAMAWAHRGELSSGTSPDPEGAARGFQRWRAWALAARAWSVAPMAATLEDLAVGARAPSAAGHPEGSSECEALAWRMQDRGGWAPAFMIPHMQRAVEELAAMDARLADAEAARLVAQERARAERRAAAGLDRR